MSAPVDETTEVREEDGFDVAAVVAWLGEQGHPVEGPVEVRQFPGGASNLTYALTAPGRDWILRRPPSGQKARGAHDMGREYRVQAALAEPFGLVPTMVAHCEDSDVIGSEFYVMERLAGLIPRRELGVDLDPDRTRALCTNVLDVLVRLHAVEPTGDLAALGKGPGYVERQVSGWSTRFRNARTPDVGDYEAVMAWLEEHRPDDVGTCVIHNDYRFDNVVLDADDPTRVRGVLDWEMATVGDPLMDLGGTLAYWVQADDDEFFQQFRRQPSQLPGMLTREEVLGYYCDATGLDIPARDRLFYEVFGLFRLGVISQQIHYRYFHGQTSNERFAVFGPAAAYLEQRCRRLLGLD